MRIGRYDVQKPSYILDNQEQSFDYDKYKIAENQGLGIASPWSNLATPLMGALEKTIKKNEDKRTPAAPEAPTANAPPAPRNPVPNEPPPPTVPRVAAYPQPNLKSDSYTFADEEELNKRVRNLKRSQY